MESITNLIDSIPKEYEVVIGVVIIFLVTLILYILTKEKAPEEQVTEGQEAEPESAEARPQAQPQELLAEAPVEKLPEPAQETEAVEVIQEPEPLPEPSVQAEAEPVEQTQQMQQPAEPIQPPTSPPPAPQPQKVETPPAEPEIKEPEAPKESFFSRLRTGLSKTRSGFVDRLDAILNKTEIDDEVWDEFEETLVMADLGVTTTMKLREDVEREIERNAITDPHEIRTILKTKILDILKNAEGKSVNADSKPFVMMVAGVNGVGKTTTIGKLSNKFKNENKKVMVAAADTFRAAAVDQLEVWADRVGAEFIRGQRGADPSAVAFDAVKASVSRGMDILIIDTAGRLHTRDNLMDELRKMRKVVSKDLEGAPHETLLVLDATTGQNAVQQAKLFNEAIDLTGIALTKLDGTAKGGVIISIANELNIPVKYIGIGERLEDLREFDAEEFVEALFESGSQTIH